MRYLLAAVVFTLTIGMVCAFAPMGEVEAGSLHWEAGKAKENQNGEWVIWAELKDGNGDVQQSVQTGTTTSKRKARKASKELAESLNEAGSGFKWDPACEGQIFLC
jgi:hypothetical protein